MSLARKTLPARRQPMKRTAIKPGDKPLKRAKPMAKRSVASDLVNRLRSLAEDLEAGKEIRCHTVIDGKRVYSTLRKRNPKRAKQDRQVNHLKEFHSSYVDGCGLCWICFVNAAAQVHHIASRNHRLRHHQTNLLPVCISCHEDLIPRMPVPVVFAFRKMRYPGSFDKEIAAELLRAKNGRVDL